MYNDYYDSIAKVAETDSEVADAMALELKRQRENIELIASENLVSPQVMAAMGSVLTNKYAEGLPGKRYYGGCQYVDIVENIAIKRACELFGCKFANVQPHSGAQANTAVYLALLELQLLAQIVKLRLRRADLSARVRKHLLSVLQVVAGDEVLDI